MFCVKIVAEGHAVRFGAVFIAIIGRERKKGERLIKETKRRLRKALKSC